MENLSSSIYLAEQESSYNARWIVSLHLDITYLFSSLDESIVRLCLVFFFMLSFHNDIWFRCFTFPVFVIG